MAPKILRLLPLFLIVFLLKGGSSAPSLLQSPGDSATSGNPTEGADDTTSDQSPRSLLLVQLKNPAEILAILLIIGGDIVQKAIAQTTGQNIWYVTPVAFSFGWVAFSFNATMAIFGDGILMPRPEDEISVIDLDSGTQKKNESWLLYRLVRDLEVRSKNGKHAIRLFNTVGTPGKPKRDKLWYLFFFVLAGQFVLAAAPQWQHGNWRILLVTGIGTVLAAITGSLPQWKKEKYDARKNNRNYILTRGNGHPHSFVLLNGPPNKSFNLEDLAVVRPDLVSKKSTKFAMPLLLLGWVFLLITVGGLEEDTWYLFGVGALGMAQNLLVAGFDRSHEAHGLPLRELNVEIKKEDRTMDVLYAVEDLFPGVGIRLLDIYFGTTKLRPAEDSKWTNYKETLDTRLPKRMELLADAARRDNNDGREEGVRHPRIGILTTLKKMGIRGPGSSPSDNRSVLPPVTTGAAALEKPPAVASSVGEVALAAVKDTGNAVAEAQY